MTLSSYERRIFSEIERELAGLAVSRRDRFGRMLRRERTLLVGVAALSASLVLLAAGVTIGALVVAVASGFGFGRPSQVSLWRRRLPHRWWTRRRR